MPSTNGSQRIKFDNFKFGDYGSFGGTKAAPEGSFNASNMIVYADGLIGPRPGWKNRTPSSMPTGKINGIAATSTPTRDFIFIIGNTVYSFDLATPGAVATMGTLGSTPTLGVYPKYGTTELYVPLNGDKIYKIDPVANTVTAVTNSPSALEVEIYGARMVAVAPDLNRILYSAAGDYTSWPVDNFTNIGDLWAVSALRTQQNHLTIMKSRGTYILTGTPGTPSSNVRKIDSGLGPLLPNQAELDQSDLISFIPAFRQNPAAFNGAQVQQVAHVNSLSGVRDSTAALPLVRGIAASMGDQAPATTLVAQGGGANIMLINHNGVWTKHLAETTISGMTRGGFTGDFYVTDGGAAGVAGKIFSNVFSLNRPGLSTDALTSIGDNSSTPLTCYLELPQWWADDGTEVCVRQVVVDFKKWNTGASATNHFDISATTFGRFNAAPNSTTSVSFDQAGASVGSVGDSTTDRKVADVALSGGGIFGAGFSVRLDAVRGVAIRSITVEVEVRPQSPRR